MLAQHMVTRPVFDALFGTADFSRHNSVAQGMQTVIDVLKPENFESELESLQGFYDSVRRRVQHASGPGARQKILVELYDKFFRNAFPMLTQRLGIVYTPVEIVDFIIRSVQDVLQDEFDTSLGAPGVHILDPFTGTGTFITRLIQSGLLSKQEILAKFGGNGHPPQIHANDIVLLAYYIASANIETAFQDATGSEYRPFDGICLADTFELNEGENQLEAIFPRNSARQMRQKDLDIRVIIGNPPWSTGQKTENDNAANRRYPSLDERIRRTYAKHSTAKNKNALYDSYIRAIRWATDRIGNQGIIGFVTGSAWIERSFADGLRKCLADEFSNLYVIHLRGDGRKTMLSGDTSEGASIFGQGSMTGAAISILVKNPTASSHGNILFHDIGPNLDLDTKRNRITDLGSIRSIASARKWTAIHPDRNHDWLDLRDPAFNRHLAMQPHTSSPTPSLFHLHSRGIASCRDAWTLNFSPTSLIRNIQRIIDFYNQERTRIHASPPIPNNLDSVLNTDPTSISWSADLKNNLRHNKPLPFDSGHLAPSLYRPFTKTWFFFSRRLNERVYQIPRIFPHADAANVVICVTGKGSRAPFSTLITNAIPSLDTLEKSQCFPLYRYEKIHPTAETMLDNAVPDHHGYVRRSAISDQALAHFRQRCSHPEITPEDLFHYTYAILHAPAYRKRYRNNLSRELPRIPAVANTFEQFAEAGRNLANLHLNYETLDPWPVSFPKGSLIPPEGASSEDWFHVTRMKHPKSKDRSTIIYNDHITVSGIPDEAWEYQISGHPALWWVMQRQAIRTDKASGIVNDANRYAIETVGDPAYPLKLLLRVIRVATETQRIVSNLPDPEESL